MTEAKPKVMTAANASRSAAARRPARPQLPRNKQEKAY
jgi:hypothetical protein